MKYALSISFSATVFLVVSLLPTRTCAQSQATWQSDLVHYNDDGALVYETTANGNRIPDFSWAGYRNGNVPLPDVPTVMTIGPIDGDDTNHIQKALDEVGTREPDADGFRGALKLKAGTYQVRGTLRLDHSGVVLRGAGDEVDASSNTIIEGIGDQPHQRNLIVAGGGNKTQWRGATSGTRTNVTTEFTRVGARQFEVANASGYEVGDNIVIYHPCTKAWLEAVDYGATGGDEGWKVGSQPIFYNRYIKAIEGNTITIGAPVFNDLDRSLSQSYIYKYDRAGLVTHVGVEKLRLDIKASGESEDHVWNAVALVQVEDAWVRNVTALHFGYGGVKTATASRVTVREVKAFDPVAEVRGARMYNFVTNPASQQILFQQCHARNGRHHYVSNGTSSVSGVVFYRSTSKRPYAGSEGHRRWSQGLLYDNHVELTGLRTNDTQKRNQLGLYNRSDSGTGHGWAAAHSVAWRATVKDEGELYVQKPPTAQNYAIGCFGTVTGETYKSQSHPEGYIEGTNRPLLQPKSLYAAQLKERTGRQATPVISPAKPGDTWVMLEAGFPNPVRHTATITYTLPKVGTVDLSLYDVTGRRVSTLVKDRKEVGTHHARLDATDLAAGVYIFHLSVGPITKSRKIIVVH